MLPLEQDMVDQVVAALQGGLGNQLFEYAAGLALAKRLDAELCLDISSYDDPRARHYALAPFGLPERVERRDTTPLPRGGWPDRMYRAVSRRLGLSRCGLSVFTERKPGFDARFFDLDRPVLLDGYFQSPEYFTDIAEVIRTRIASPKGMSEASMRLLRHIEVVDAICMHVRRGDYVSNSSFNQFHGLCGLEYYLEAVPLASAGMRAPHVFVFSDDPAWVRDNVRLPCALTVVDVNAEDAAHEDLWLMAACQRFVIANSSFSWWAAWLGSAKDKVVVAPRQWFANGSPEPHRLIPQDWIRL